jgi:hypothetical protein
MRIVHIMRVLSLVLTFFFWFLNIFVPERIKRKKTVRKVFVLLAKWK